MPARRRSSCDLLRLVAAESLRARRRTGWGAFRARGRSGRSVFGEFDYVRRENRLKILKTAKSARLVFSLGAETGEKLCSTRACANAGARFSAPGRSRERSGAAGAAGRTPGTPFAPATHLGATAGTERRVRVACDRAGGAGAIAREWQRPGRRRLRSIAFSSHSAIAAPKNSSLTLQARFGSSLIRYLDPRCFPAAPVA